MESISAIIQKINTYASQQQAFLLLVDFDLQQPQLFTLDALLEQDIEIQFPGFHLTQPSSNSKTIKLQKQPISYDEFKEGLDIIMHHIAYGNTYLTNYTCSTPVHCNANFHEIFTQATAKYKIRYKQEWVCFSPEIFVRIANGQIAAYPMKGTIDAAIPDAERIILEDPKETAEHYTIVDLIRNDLSKIATSVQVKKFRYIDTIQTSNKNLLQVSSEITGILPDNYLSQLGEILFALLPAGSISGAPKKKTVDIIHMAESHKRNFYTGVAFLFDGQTIDSCVLIRMIENQSGQWVYKSGGGITMNSVAKLEYQEMLDKVYVPTI